VCGSAIGAWSHRGRPRVYCGDSCRWRAGHLAARQRAGGQRRQQLEQWAAMTPADQLEALVAAMPVAEPGGLRAPDGAAAGEWAAISPPREG
jgi:hypothetical protein